MTLEISAGQSAFSHLARHSAATCPTSCCGLTTMVDDQFFFPHTHFVHFLVDLLWTRPRTTTTISFVRHSLQRCRRRRTWAVFWIAVGGSSPGAHNRDLDERARSNQVEELRKLSLANRVFIYHPLQTAWRPVFLPVLQVHDTLPNDSWKGFLQIRLSLAKQVDDLGWDRGLDLVTDFRLSYC